MTKEESKQCEADEKPIINKAVALRDAIREKPFNATKYANLAQELLNLVADMNRLQLILGLTKYQSLSKEKDDEYDLIAWAIEKAFPTKGIHKI